jgi:hypothetical protein
MDMFLPLAVSVVAVIAAPSSIIGLALFEKRRAGAR